MTEISLLVASQKVKRTKAQIRELNSEVVAFVSAARYSIATELNADATQKAWVFRFEPQSTEHLSIIVGEILHNLRSALDYLAVALATKNGASSKKVYFPFGINAEIFDEQVRKKTKGMSADAIAMIRELKPYKGGNVLLWLLHDLNREDKHIRIVPLFSGNGMKLYELAVIDGTPYVLGNRRGQHLRTEIGRAVVAKGPDPIVGETDYEFLTTSPLARFEGKLEPTINVVFQEAGDFKNQSIIAVLVQMSDLVESILLTFERRFFG